MNHSLDEQEKRILGDLLARGRMTFQEVVTLGSNRQRARDRLDNLKEKELVAEENRDTWRRGQKLWIVPTEKGKKWIVERVTEDMKETCRILQVLVESASTPEKVFKMKKAANLVPKEALKREPSLLYPSDLHEMLAHKWAIIGPLWDIVKGLVRILVQIESPIGYTETLSNVEIRFSEEGEPLLKLCPGIPPSIRYSPSPESLSKGKN